MWPLNFYDDFAPARTGITIVHIGCKLDGTMRTATKNKGNSDGHYEVTVVKAHEGSFFHESPDQYYSGNLDFVLPNGRGGRTHVNKYTLGLRKTYWCVPDDPDKDNSARTAEHKRYLPALKLYQAFFEATGKRYELERDKDPHLPLLPEVDSTMRTVGNAPKC